MLAATVGPLTARADQHARRVGYLAPQFEDDAEVNAWLAAFRAALQELGWDQSHNLVIEYRWAGGDQDRLRRYAAELVGLKPDVLFAAATPALVALYGETNTIPIVFAQSSDPVKLGFVESLAHPGGNITGFTNFEPSIGGKWLDLINATAPAVTRVAVIFHPDNPSNVLYFQSVEDAAQLFGIRLVRADVRDSADIDRTINAFAQQPRGGLIVLPSLPAVVHRQLIIDLAARLGLPAIYPYRMFTSAGGFISYGIDVVDEYRRAASYVDRILKGTEPADLPIQQPMKFELVINLKSAKTLGIDVSPNLLAQADEVIE